LLDNFGLLAACRWHVMLSCELAGVFTANRHVAGSTFIARFPLHSILLAA